MGICRNCFRKRTRYSDIFCVLGRRFWQLHSGVVSEISQRQVFCVLNEYIKKLTWRRMSSTKSTYLKHTTYEWISLQLPPPIHWHTTEACGGSWSGVQLQSDPIIWVSHGTDVFCFFSLVRFTQYKAQDYKDKSCHLILIAFDPWRVKLVFREAAMWEFFFHVGSWQSRTSL